MTLGSYFLTSFGAVTPGQAASESVESVEDVVEGPGDDDDVVDVLQEHHHEGRVSDSLEDGTELADDAHPADPEVLTDGDLQKEERDPAGQHGHEVRDQKGP